MMRNKFSLVVFGRTDIRRRFFPIAFMLTSHEEENDFKYFYDSIIGLVSKLNFNFKAKMYICTE